MLCMYVYCLDYPSQVMVKHVKGGKEVRMDLMIMENLLYGRHVTRIYDLKGSLRSRYNADMNRKDAVLLDQNMVDSFPNNPIFISTKDKRLLERAVWNDTAFLAVSFLTKLYTKLKGRMAIPSFFIVSPYALKFFIVSPSTRGGIWGEKEKVMVFFSFSLN